LGCSVVQEDIIKYVAKKTNPAAKIQELQPRLMVENPPRRLGRQRDEATRSAILRAAHDVLVEKGMAGFTIEAVAARAGSGKTTIYRWWPSKGSLAMAGFLTEIAPKISYSNSRSALADLTDQLRRVASVYGGASGRVLSAIIAEGQRDPATIEAFVEGYAKPRRAEAKRILLAGIERGELRPNIDLEVALDALYGPIYYRMLVPVGPLNERWVKSLAEHVFSGLRRQVNARRRTSKSPASIRAPAARKLQ
jgi:AcrR family transcriptional regulator